MPAHTRSRRWIQNHGLFGLDRFDENEAHGIYSRPNQKRVDYAVLLTMGSTAIWEGTTSSPVGKAMWQSIDASLTTSLGAGDQVHHFAPAP